MAVVALAAIFASVLVLQFLMAASPYPVLYFADTR